MGPLKGFRIIEIASIGPGQFCGMLLADMGAEVLRIEPPLNRGAASLIPRNFNLMNRSRPGVPIDLKQPAAIDLVLSLCDKADALFEGFRPGVMERLGLAPDVCLQRNSRLVYGRMTGWGQEGPLSTSAGHDGNYIAVAGALHGIGDSDRLPALPGNLLGDFGGGGAYLALGMLAAMLEASRSGKGQVVDTAMVDGVASLTTMMHGMQAAGLWQDERGVNLLDGGAPFYCCYATADDKVVVVCALEPQFFVELLDKLGLHEVEPDTQYAKDTWPLLADKLADAFRQRDRDEWAALFADSDACVSPVLTLSESRRHPHLVERGTYIEIDGIVQPAPAPRFSRTSNAQPTPPATAAEPRELLKRWGAGDATLDAVGL